MAQKSSIDKPISAGEMAKDLQNMIGFAAESGSEFRIYGPKIELNELKIAVCRVTGSGIEGPVTKFRITVTPES